MERWCTACILVHWETASWRIGLCHTELDKNTYTALWSMPLCKNRAQIGPCNAGFAVEELKKI